MNVFFSASYPLMSFSNGIYIPVRRVRVMMLNAGFSIDYENDVFVKKTYGAYMENIPQKITKIEDFNKYYDHYTGKNQYKEILDLIDIGYQFVIGPGAPLFNGKIYGNGLYCKNYKEFIK